MKKIILIALILILSSTISFAAEKTINAVSDPWPPFADPSHPKEGLSLEVIRAAFKTQGYNVKMEYVPWKRALGGVTSGKYDILTGAWVTEERKKDMMYSKPYAVNSIKFIKRADDPFEFNGLDSLSGKTVGIVRGYGYGDEFSNATNFKREESKNFITNIRKLTHKNKRVDLAVEDEIVARVTIANESAELIEKVKFTNSALSSKPLHITSGYQNPRHMEIINAFNMGLEEIKANGVYNKIMESYGITN